MKPMSAMRSASSSTSTCTSATESSRRSMRSINRPGVPMTTSTPLRERLDLRVHADTAVERLHLQPLHAAERGEHAAHLVGQLAGRYEDESVRVPRLGLRDAVEQGEPEGQCLARPGLRLAEHVAPGEGVGDGQGLDRERLGETLGGQGVDELGRHAQRVEGHGHRGSSLSVNCVGRFGRVALLRRDDRDRHDGHDRYELREVDPRAWSGLADTMLSPGFRGKRRLTSGGSGVTRAWRRRHWGAGSGRS